MSFEQVAEQPRHVIISARVNPTAELARWLFEHYRIAYHEEPHAPFLRVSLRQKGGIEGLAVVGPEGAWTGAREVLNGLDAKSRPGQRLYGESDAERAANRANVTEILQLCAQGKLSAHVHETYPLEKIAQALHALAGRTAMGKVILRP